MSLTYFKRYRMEMRLEDFSRKIPALPDGYRCIPWNESLLEHHAETKYRCFCYEITRRDNFIPQATWLMEYCDSEGTVTYCGTIQGLRDQEGRGAVQNLGMTTSHRGQGLGTILLTHALNGFLQHDLDRATLEVTAQNSGALRMYQRFGFQVTKTVYKAAEVAFA